MMQELDSDGCCTRCGAINTLEIASCEYSFDKLFLKKMSNKDDTVKYELRMIDENENSIYICLADDEALKKVIDKLNAGYERFVGKD